MGTGKKQVKKSFFILLLILLIGSICGTAMAATQAEIDEAIDNPDSGLGYRPEGIYTITSGTIDILSGPSWVTVLNVNGGDGGHLAVQLDSSQVSEYTVYNIPEGGSIGSIALEPGDIFIEWDENSGHQYNHQFSFSGGYVAQTPSYAMVQDTYWTVYTVTSSGILTGAAGSNCCADHSAIHMQIGQPPVASFTYSPEEPIVGWNITFDASASYDPDGTIESYEWNFGDGNTASDQNVTHAYSEPGGYTVALTVTDNDGLTDSNSQTVQITVPVVSFLDREKLSRKVRGAAADGASEVVIQITGLPEDATSDDIQIFLPGGAADGSLENDKKISNGVLTQTYLAPENFVKETQDLTRGQREIELKCIIEPSGYEIKHEPFCVVKPPVVLLHGLWSNPSAWDNLKSKLETYHKYPYVIAPEYTNSTYFYHLKNVMYLSTFSAIDKAREDKVVAKKVDVVAHSMGGLIAKLYGEESSIRSITTVGTPHYGSPLADGLWWIVVNDQIPLNRFIVRRLEALGMPANNGAIEDLRVNGGIHCDADNVDVSNYVISGISPLTNETTVLFINLLAKVFKFAGLLPVTATLLDFNQFIFEGERNDFVVSESSQEGGMEGDDTYVLWHCSEPNSVEVLQKIISFLNGTETLASLDQTSFKNSQEASRLQQALSTLEIGISSGTVQITKPSEGQVFQPGDTVDIEVNTSDENAMVLITTSTGESALIEHAPYNFQFIIPDEVIGPVNIGAGARDDIGFIGSDEVTINVSSSSNLIGIKVYPEMVPLYMSEEVEIPLTVHGQYDDGIVRDITFLPATHYTSSNPRVLEVSSDGVISAKSEGRAAITVENSGVVETINVVVLSFVDFTKYAVFANHWMDQNCAKPGWCENADLDRNGEVDILDLGLFVENWLEYVEMPFLTLVKVDDVNEGDCVWPGREITYTISYGNPVTDPCDPVYIGEVNDVNIIDYLPEEVDFDSASAGGVYDSNSRTVRWAIGTIQPSDANSVTLKVKVKYPEPGGTITNCCKMKSGGQVLNSDEEDTPVCSNYLTLTKVDDVNDGGCVGPGDEITYTIYYSEPNCGDINDVNIIDYMPGAAGFIVADSNGTYDPCLHTVTWNLDTLSPGESGFATLTVKVKCPEPGSTIRNECEIKSGDQTLNETYENTPVCCCCCPTLTKVDDVNGCVGPGDNITYSICYAAHGYGDTNVVITDSLPSEVEFISASGDWIYDSGTVTWNIGTLGSNETGCVMLTVRVRPCVEPGSTITNSCELRGNCISPIYAQENTSVCSIYPTLTKVDDVNGCVGPGDNITYSICYAAHGYGDTNVVITDSLPSEVEFISASGDWIYDSGTVTWNIGTLGSNETGCVMLTVRVKCPEPNGTITNHCEMRGDCISPIYAEENTPVCCCCCPTLTKVDDVNGCVGRGDNVTYTICYAAHGYGDRNVVIIDNLPPGVEFVSATGDWSYDSGTVTWNIGTLGSNESGCVTLTVKVKCAERGGTITDRCELRGDCISPIYAQENTSVCYYRYPMFTKVDDVNSCVRPEDNITYRICYDANGYSDTNVSITDYLPGGVNYVSSNPSGIYHPDDHTVTWGIALPSDACGCIELVVQVNTMAGSGGIIANHCELRGDCIEMNIYKGTPVCCWKSVSLICVDGNANGLNNGTSWKNAYNYLQDAFLVARDCDCNEIRVAAGTYKPDRNSVHPNGTGNRGATFELKNGVAIKGGYAGFGEPDPNAQYIRQYETILSGDLKGNDRQVDNPLDLENDPCRADNSYHVVTGSGVDNTAVLDGFTLTGGYAKGSFSMCGGGMYNYGGSPTVTNCTFSGNAAFGPGDGHSNGGGMYNYGGSPTVRNCIFSGNVAYYPPTSGGGGMYNYYSSPTVTNCTFIGNISDSVGGIYDVVGGGNVTNCILWGNEGGQISGGNVTYSAIQDGYEGVGNIDADPMFAVDGYHLILCSPCIDAGTNTPPGGLPEEDIDGEERIMDSDCDGVPRIDMGVDEYYPTDCNVFLRAHCPKPACGAADVPRDVVLCWKPGVKADKHDVYFGTDRTAVINANDPNTPPGRGRQDSNCFDPCTGLLNFDTTYYWRIDEVNGSTIWRGDVWHFLTLPYFVIVDDFESYGSDEELKAVWKDYWYNGTCAEVFLEYTTVHSGYQSMKYRYSNKTYSPYYSEAEATIGTGTGKLNIDPNWLGLGAKALSLWFYGDPCNPVGLHDKMYIKLTDGDTPAHTAKVFYSDTNDVRKTKWQEWNIPLTGFSGVNLRKVAKIVIGFGDWTQSTSDGIAYFDDIRLYPTRCVLAEREADLALVDFAPAGATPGDCAVDNLEIESMASTWLVTDSIRDTCNPGDANLVVYYPLNEGDGNKVYSGPPDACNPKWTGTFYNTWTTPPGNVGTSWSTDHAPGIGGNSCIYINGDAGSRVSCGTYGQAGLGIGPYGINAMTLSIWAKWLGPRT